MNLYLLRRKDADDTYYDEFYGFVIRTTSPKRARQIAQDKGADETRRGDFWTNPDLTTCKELLPDGGEEGVVIEDFLAG